MTDPASAELHPEDFEDPEDFADAVGVDPTPQQVDEYIEQTKHTGRGEPGEPDQAGPTDPTGGSGA